MFGAAETALQQSALNPLKSDPAPLWTPQLELNQQGRERKGERQREREGWVQQNEKVEKQKVWRRRTSRAVNFWQMFVCDIV